jgi:hypothetical protein
MRKDAANRSARNVQGKVTEHLIPLSEAMRHFNPKDVRLIGSSIATEKEAVKKRSKKWIKLFRPNKLNSTLSMRPVLNHTIHRVGINFQFYFVESYCSSLLWQCFYN